MFETAGDPVKLGLVASLNRPGRNITGVSQLSSELVSKRLGLLHDLIPTAKIIGLLVNPADPRAETQIKDMQEAARIPGLQIKDGNAPTEGEIDTAFAMLSQLHVGGNNDAHCLRVWLHPSEPQSHFFIYAEEFDAVGRC